MTWKETNKNINIQTSNCISKDNKTIEHIKTEISQLEERCPLPLLVSTDLEMLAPLHKA